MKVLIVSNGDAPPTSRLKIAASSVDLIIAADGGANCLFKSGITPHVLVGDFDSVRKSILELYQQSGVECLQFPEAKDSSDHELAVEIALNRGAKEIIFAGMLGGRIEYALTNILLYARRSFAGINISILDGEKGTILILCPNRTYSVACMPQSSFSLVPLTVEVSQVNLSGAAWTLKDETLYSGKSLSLSNRSISDTISIHFSAGSLLLSYQTKNIW